VARLRISSLQPQELSEELLELWQDKRLCPHFHIPLQSGSDSILARMRRRYDSSQFMKSVDDVRKNVEGASVTTDLIVGFPGESKQDHLDTKRICEAVGFADLHVFRFSSRPGTIAFHMDDDVRDPTKAYRSNELIDIGRQSFSKFRRSLDGNVANVLWEAEAKDRSNSDRFFGLTENYIRVSSEKYRTEMPIEEVTLVFNGNDPYGPMQCLG
jgi:threonylcarbamoyladenosine tRNA methylthiotransferase MtaB